MQVTPDQLRSESDVESKVLMPLIVGDAPLGFGYSYADVLTKNSIYAYKIGKGKEKKLYVPDFVIQIAGLPVLVVEAKRPKEDLLEALREAQLYAFEINKAFKSGINPVQRVIASDGLTLISAPIDQAEPDIRLTLDELTPAHLSFASLHEQSNKQSLSSIAVAIKKKFLGGPLARAVEQLGGKEVQNEVLTPQGRNHIEPCDNHECGSSKESPLL